MLLTIGHAYARDHLLHGMCHPGRTRPCGIVARGLYADITRTWVSVFGRNHTLVVRHSDLLRVPALTLKRIFRFAGVDEALCDSFPRTPSGLIGQRRARVVRQWFARYQRSWSGHLSPKQLRDLLERERFLYAVCGARVGMLVSCAATRHFLHRMSHPGTPRQTHVTARRHWGTTAATYFGPELGTSFHGLLWLIG